MTTILFKNFCTDAELEVCRKYFRTVALRTECKNSLVIGRYSTLPYYEELEADLKNLNCRLINTTSEHKWIASFDYYHELQDYTPETWFDHNFYKCDYSGPFVVKGATNSQKFKWNTKMFAASKRDAVKLGADLASDPFIGPQGIIYRKYVPLKTLEVGINGLPFAHEFRYFFVKKKLVAAGYYWTIAENPISGILPIAATKLARKIADIASEFCTFFAVDVAETRNGDWILIELNDGQQAGLPELDPVVFYENLKNCLIC